MRQLSQILFSRHSLLDKESRVSRENGNLFPYSSLLSQGRRLDSRFCGNDNTASELILRKLRYNIILHLSGGVRRRDSFR